LHAFALSTFTSSTEATEHDTGYVEKYDEDPTTSLVFVCLSSAVRSAFVIDVHSKLELDPNERSV